MKINIIETKDRSILSEGRSTGMGFAFLKKEENNYSTVQPLSPCKDYLNEIVFTENTGIPSKAHGLVYKEKNNIFTKFAYLAIKIVDKNGNYYYSSNIENDKQLLKNNYKKIQNFINQIEELFEIKSRTIIISANDNYFLVKLPINWCKSTISISLYSLLLRVALVYENEKSPLEYLKEYSYNQEDRSLLNSAIPRLENLLKEKILPDQPIFSEDSAKNYSWSPHDIGILSYKLIIN